MRRISAALVDQLDLVDATIQEADTWRNQIPREPWCDIVKNRALTETGAAHRVGRVDPRVNGEARGGDVASGFEVAGGRFGELVGLRDVGADLRSGNCAGA